MKTPLQRVVDADKKERRKITQWRSECLDWDDCCVFSFMFFLFFFFYVWTITSHGFTVYVLKNIKNRSHDTIHIFKNYFAIVLSVFSFQFLVSATISSIQTDPSRRNWKCLWLGLKSISYTGRKHKYHPKWPV